MDKKYLCDLLGVALLIIAGSAFLLGFWTQGVGILIGLGIGYGCLEN